MAQSTNLTASQLILSINALSLGGGVTADDFYREAYERIGIRGANITSELIRSAEMSANMALSSWMGKGPNGWTIKRNLIELVPGQSSYQLPRNITQVINAVGTKPVIVNTAKGTPVTTATPPEKTNPQYTGSLQNLFAPLNEGANLPVVAWNGPPSDVAFFFNEPTTVNYVGVVPSSSNSLYQFEILGTTEKYVEGAPPVWTSLCVFSVEKFDVFPVTWLTLPCSRLLTGVRLQQLNMDNKLSLSHLFFANSASGVQSNAQSTAGDRMLGAISYSDWMALPNKNSQNMPTSYFVDTQLEPIMNLWPVPNEKSLTTFTHILYNAYQYPYSVNNLFSSFNVPQKFFDAITADLSYRLASKWKSEDPNNLQRLKQDSEQAFALAVQTDSQNYSININPNFEGLRA